MAAEATRTQLVVNQGIRPNWGDCPKFEANVALSIYPSESSTHQGACPTISVQHRPALGLVH